MLIELRSVSSKWKEFGKQLQYTSSELQQMKVTSYGTDFGAFIELCDNWLRKTKKPTWKMLAQALKNINEQQLSENILKINKTGNKYYIR